MGLRELVVRSDRDGLTLVRGDSRHLETGSSWCCAWSCRILCPSVGVAPQRSVFFHPADKIAVGLIET